MKLLILLLLTVLYPDTEYMLQNVGTGQYLCKDGTLTEDPDVASDWRLVSWEDSLSGEFQTHIYCDEIVLALRNYGFTGWQTTMSGRNNTTVFVPSDNGAYKLRYRFGTDTRYLNVESPSGKITAARTASVYNDWLFVPSTHDRSRRYRILKFDREGGFSCYSLAYKSRNVYGEERWLSGWVKFPTDGEGGRCKADHQLYSCHATITSNDEAPSVMGPYDAITSSIMTNMPVWMEPDYLGFGKSLGEEHPYVAPDIMAETCVDMMLAVYDMLYDMHGLDMYEAQLPTYGAGYSQGGGVILAIQRYIENSPNLTEAQRAAIHYVSTCCGAGPYNTLATISQYLYDDVIAMPVAAPLLVSGMVSAYPEIFGDYRAEDYFSEAFNQAGILQKMRSCSYKIDDLNKQITNACGGRMSGMLSEQVKDFNSDLAQRLLWALGASDLTRDWVPQARIWMYHSDSDDVVPYLNGCSAYNSFREVMPAEDITFYVVKGKKHTEGAIDFNFLMITGGYKK